MTLFHLFKRELIRPILSSINNVYKARKTHTLCKKLVKYKKGVAEP